ncbi:ShlB/FhaC/HecB family hemolysin secretion/activation protein [Azoarcus sp. KH32C]|uniref:ShlB/FhaC/HecB family hemolysin secretion/activation protein n=1 Tax=Azoarcus sp. KH32C TaxID=748247 RepID=UPI0002386384|nr:ShlB/FhaC/HecB family hemolysin secretion/activation protein [Azoarcus sp. KH32C]BAL23052.1 hemolysin activation/secretion protein [Azoarcus sp. KH32C]
MRTRLCTTLALLAAGSVACHAAPGEAVEEGARFPIQEIQVGGNTLVASDTLRLRLATFLGEAKSVQDLLAARQAIVAAYQEVGRPFVAVGLPEEFGTDGVVRLQVVEIPVREIRIEGNERLSAARIRARLPSLVEEESPAMDEISRQLALANDNPALKLSIEFLSRGDMAADARISVEESAPVSFAITTDNTGTAETGHWRVGLSVTDADLTGFGDVASLTYITSPEDADKVHQYAASYLWPLARLGDALIFSGSYSDVDAGRISDAFDVAGQGSSLGVRYQHTITRTVARRETLEVGVERRRYRNIVDFSGSDLGGEVASRPLTVTYAYSDQRPTFQWGASVGYAHNLPGGSGNDDQAYGEGRSGATARWSLWRVNGRIATRLPWGVVAQVSGEGQYTSDPLISGEQFGLGGARSVRGFDEREVAGDRGWRIGGELSSPQFGDWGRFAVFADRGGETRLSPLAGESSGENVASWGLGWRYNRSGFAALLDWAQVLDGTAETGRGHQKIHVQASLQF